jgi:hypothetical protein
MKLPKHTWKVAEWFVVSIVAVVMSRVGYFLLDSFTDQKWSEWRDPAWVLWSCGVSVVTWTVIWRATRAYSLGVWMLMGGLSPLFGCLFFFPATAWAFSALTSYWYVIIPIGIFSGLIFHTVLLIVDRFRGRSIEDRPVS